MVAVEKLGAPLDYFTDPFLLAGEGPLFSGAGPGSTWSGLKAYEQRAGRWIAAFPVPGAAGRPRGPR